MLPDTFPPFAAVPASVPVPIGPSWVWWLLSQEASCPSGPAAGPSAWRYPAFRSTWRYPGGQWQRNIQRFAGSACQAGLLSSLRFGSAPGTAEASVALHPSAPRFLRRWRGGSDWRFLQRDGLGIGRLAQLQHVLPDQPRFFLHYF